MRGGLRSNQRTIGGLMASNTLYDKIFDKHTVARLVTGQYQLFIGLHLVHEVTSPQACDMLRERGLKLAYPKRTIATLDHIIPTTSQIRPFLDEQAEAMARALEMNARQFDIEYLDRASKQQGIVHVVGPELGLVHPGMTVACGDSHTSTHGAFGTLAFGIGTSQVGDVLATQCLPVDRLKVRRIEVDGKLGRGVFAKDVILYIIRMLGTRGGIGYAYEYGGSAIQSMTMEQRMTVCNMSIEGGARVGYINPDQVTYDYLSGRPHAPDQSSWPRAVDYWESVKSDSSAAYDDVCRFSASDISPHVTWGINPGQCVGVDERLPELGSFSSDERQNVEHAYRHMKLRPGQKMTDVKVDVVFIGSCTNSRIEDLRAAAEIVKNRNVAKHVRAIVVPGSQQVARQSAQEGLDEIFIDAGLQWREPGCSMCLAMNPDKLENDEICASTSNRNFIGRQGSPHGRTLLMSPQMAAAAAINGQVTDIRSEQN